MKAFSHRFISPLTRCYVLPRELYPLMKTKYVVSTQISILFQWQSLLQFSHPYLVYCWTCSCPEYSWNTAPTINHYISFHPSIYRASAYIPFRKTKFFVGSNWSNNRIIPDPIDITNFAKKAIKVLWFVLNLDRKLCE